MNKMLSMAFLALFLPVNVQAQIGLFEENWYVGLEGTKGNQDLRIELILTDNDRLIGKSCPSSSEDIISYSGQLNDQKISLDVQNHKGVIGRYTLLPDIRDNFVEGYVGQYVDKATQDTKSVKLRYKTGFYGTPEKRYLDFLGSDKDLERFAKKVITSFQLGEKQWLSENISVPMLAYVQDGRTLEINSPKEFIEKFEVIATEVLLANLSSSPTCNFWVNHNGVMLGNGEVWIWEDSKSTNEKPTFVIKNVKSY